MKLERVKCKPLERAKNLCVSESYIIGCTGPKAVILNKDLNLLHTVEGLEYVYSAQLSPDETKLLLISNVNKFYIVDLQTFEKTRVTVKAPYHHNLYGRGCWSFDSKYILIPVHRSSGYINSTLRRYRTEDCSQYEDFLADKYLLHSITPLDTGHYFLTGCKREESNSDYFIIFDGAAFQEIPLENTRGMIISGISVDTGKRLITISAVDSCRQFTFEGKEVALIRHPDPQEKTLQIADVFLPMLGDGKKQEEAGTVFHNLHPQNITAPDFITKYDVSGSGQYIYLASQSGFYLLSQDQGDILASVPEEYGVQNFEELTPELIAISTWNGVKLYRITD